MPLAETIGSHLPYLRRFARALTGSQKSGDAYVAVALEAIVADPSTFDRGLAPRVALYRVFLSIWNSISANATEPEEVEGALGAAHRKLEAITPFPRQAFILTAIEGFTSDEAADVLGIDEPILRALVDEAGREIAAQVATDVLIIEDEPLIAMDLETLVNDLGHRPIGVARTHDAALKLASSSTPGLVLADIQLADGSSGIDAVNDLLVQFDVPVIFITAYPERLLTGEKPEPAFLITKPFQTETVKAVISQALFFEEHARQRASV